MFIIKSYCKHVCVCSAAMIRKIKIIKKSFEKKIYIYTYTGKTKY